MNSPTRARTWTLIAIALLVSTVAYLSFAVFGIHTLFLDDEVDEAAPVFDSSLSPSGLASDVTTTEQTDESDQATIETGTPPSEHANDDMPAPEVVVEASGSFVDRSHPATGVAQVLGDGTGQRFLRFEGFETDNGPDLNVYLSTAASDAPAGEFDDDFVDLGDLKGNIGPQNYEIPTEVDLSQYRTVVIWCVRFGVAFGAAQLVAT